MGLTKNILKYTLLLFAITYIVLDLLDFYFEADILRIIAHVLLFVLYYQWTVQKSTLFLWFLIADIIGNLIGFVTWFDGIVQATNSTYLYYFNYDLFMISYSFLILYITSKLSLKEVFKNFRITIFIFSILSVLCVILISATNNQDDSYSFYDIIQTYTYNTVVMVLLLVSLVNFMYRSDMKSMLLLLGCMSFFFTEIMWMAYFFTTDKLSINLISSFSIILGYIFIYSQSQIQYKEPEADIIEQ